MRSEAQKKADIKYNKKYAQTVKNVRISNDLREQLEHIQKETGKTLNECLAMLIQFYRYTFKPM